jgi:hypothetical protein
MRRHDTAPHVYRSERERVMVRPVGRYDRLAGQLGAHPSIHPSVLREGYIRGDKLWDQSAVCEIGISGRVYRITLIMGKETNPS